MRVGISIRQGPHHEAQKTKRVASLSAGFKVKDSPENDSKVKAGICPEMGRRSSPHPDWKSAMEGTMDNGREKAKLERADRRLGVFDKLKRPLSMDGQV